MGTQRYGVYLQVSGAGQEGERGGWTNGPGGLIAYKTLKELNLVPQAQGTATGANTPSHGQKWSAENNQFS